MQDIATRRVLVKLLCDEPEKLLELLDVAEADLEHQLTLNESDGIDEPYVDNLLGHLGYIRARVVDAIKLNP